MGTQLCLAPFFIFFFFFEFLIGFSHDAARVPSSWKALMLVLTPPGLGHVTC